MSTKILQLARFKKEFSVETEQKAELECQLGKSQVNVSQNCSKLYFYRQIVAENRGVFTQIGGDSIHGGAEK